MIFLCAIRSNGVVRVSVYVDGQCRTICSNPAPTIAGGLKWGWQWLVDNWAGFPAVGNA